MAHMALGGNPDLDPGYTSSLRFNSSFIHSAYIHTEVGSDSTKPRGSIMLTNLQNRTEPSRRSSEQRKQRIRPPPVILCARIQRGGVGVIGPLAEGSPG